MTYTGHAGPLWARLVVVGGSLVAMAVLLAWTLSPGSAPDPTSQLFASITSAGFGVGGVAASLYGAYLWRTDPTRRV